VLADQVREESIEYIENFKSFAASEMDIIVKSSECFIDVESQNFVEMLYYGERADE